MINFQPKKLVRWIVISLLIIVILFALIFVIVFLDTIVFGSFDLKDSFDNPHIDSNYSDWKMQSINNFDQIMIPNSWDVVEENNIIYITDERGVIAIGMVFDDSEALKNDEAYMIALYGIVPNNEYITYDSYAGRETMMGYSRYYISNLENNDGEVISHITAEIKSKALNKTLELSFIRNGTYDEEIVRSWVEAIVFAHEYTKQKNGKTYVKLTIQ